MSVVCVFDMVIFFISSKQAIGTGCVIKTIGMAFANYTNFNCNKKKKNVKNIS